MSCYEICCAEFMLKIEGTYLGDFMCFLLMKYHQNI